MTTQPLLDIQDLSISYFIRAGELPAVRDFSLQVYPGESVALVGESGCGKTTVAMAIMMYLGRSGRITQGSLLFEGRDLRSLNQQELQHLRGGRISMIYQEPFAALNPSLSIKTQLIEVPLLHEALTPYQAEQRALEILDAVHLPDPQRIMASYPHQLSGGQQQRVIIAMALLSNPSLLLCDEPTTALDVTVEAGIVQLLSEIKKTFHTSILFISHNLGLVREVCERVCVMYAGEVVEEGRIEEVFSQPRHPYTHGLFRCIPMPGADKYAAPLLAIPGFLPSLSALPSGCVFGPRCDYFQVGLCDTSKIPVIKLHDRKIRCIRSQEIQFTQTALPKQVRDQVISGAEVIRAAEVCKYYPVYERSLIALLTGKNLHWIKANDKLSFDVYKGETVAIVGESGCGKSTFAKVLIGLEETTKGALYFQDEEIGQTLVHKRSVQQRSCLQMVFQNPNDTLNPSMSIGQQIRRVLRKFKITQTHQETNKRLYELLDLVKLPETFAKRKPRQLSGGQKQRVGIARAFAGNPETVIADEPVSALDVSVQAAITELLMDLQQHQKTTLLFISHDLSLVRYLADRIIVMYLGQIMEQGTVEEIFSPPYHPYTEALLSAIPIADPSIQHKHIILEGNLPSMLHPPKGCPFASRCPYRLGEVCDTIPPPRQSVKKGHTIMCHIPIEELAKSAPVFFTTLQEQQEQTVPVEH